VQLQVKPEPQGVRVTATGQWPLATIAGVAFTLPLRAEARMMREAWQP
jgi:hypothetical protein